MHVCMYVCMYVYMTLVDICWPQNGETCLHAACKAGKVDVVNYLCSLDGAKYLVQIMCQVRHVWLLLIYLNVLFWLLLFIFDGNESVFFFITERMFLLGRVGLKLVNLVLAFHSLSETDESALKGRSEPYFFESWPNSAQHVLEGY
jgi:hypothetical protein